ncbi:OprO/OprP family phosphate-selective porin [Aquisalimonas asiatica]|uniref:Phosphate-selective porin OprO and OprP n=1 Tax=Aquisalimonas asiatica TaxID=406100 RepID=A0A1H8RS79_9GAMM|nr:porin [Aquisalimonas asiatica]SEO69137.1 phosphate-selective porin OprO and OprP [Aquisalimonas asiatica]
MKATKLTALGIAAGMGLAGISQAAAYPEFEPRGRLHIDAGFHDEDNVDMDDGFLNRRARLGVGGDLDELWDFRIEADFAEEGVSAADFRLRRSLDVGRITLGQTKVPMGLNQLTSSNNITFIERATPQNIVPDSRRMGVFYDVSEGMFTFQSALYGRAIGDDADGDMPLGVAGRFVASPELGGGQILHLGVSAAYEDFDSDSDYRTLGFSDRPESRPAGVRLISTGDIDADSTTKYGLELAYIAGPFSAEAEYVNVDVDRDNGSDVSFDGYHAQVSYVLTGESRSYGSGGFGGISPQGNGGAWEVAARYSHMDLNDRDIQGGEQDSVTLALNYYHSSNLRFMGNVIFTDVKDSGAVSDLTGGETDEDSPVTFLARMQYNF